MSINQLLTPTPPNKPWSNLYVESINVTDAIITGGNIVVANAAPSVYIKNTTNSVARASLKLSGGPSLSDAKVQQGQLGDMIIENFEPNQDIKIIPHGTGNVAVTNGLSTIGNLSTGTGLIIAGGSLLNSYVVGTFTPTLQFSTSTDTIAYNSQVGHYTRIGNVVLFSLELGITSIGTSSGNAQIFGIPFSSGGSFTNSLIGACASSGITFGVNYVILTVRSSTTHFNLGQASNVAANPQATLTETAFVALPGIINISGHYFI